MTEHEGARLDPEHQRWEAAKEYIAAADMLRLAWHWLIAEFGPDATDHEPSERYRHGATYRRLLTAEERCVALGMWSERRYVRPRRFREGRPSSGRTNGAAPVMPRPAR